MVETKLPILVIYGDEGCREGAASIAKHFIFKKQVEDGAPPSACMLPFVYVDVNAPVEPDVAKLENEFGFLFKTREELLRLGYLNLPVIEVQGTGGLSRWQGIKQDKVDAFLKYLDDNFSSDGYLGSDEYAGFWWWVQDNSDYGHTLFEK